MSVQIPAVIRGNKLAEYAFDLTERLYEEHGIEHHRTVFRNLQKATARLCQDDKPQIVYGYHLLEWAADGKRFGFVVDREVIGSRLFAGGLESVHWIVLHEFAHVLQFGRGERTWGSCHNGFFRRHLEGLLARYPYSGGHATASNREQEIQARVRATMVQYGFEWKA